MTTNDHGRGSTFHGLLKMLKITSPTLPAGTDEEAIADVDEPPDHSANLSLQKQSSQQDRESFVRSQRIPLERKESLLTKALMGTSEDHEIVEFDHHVSVPRGMSTASTQSSASAASIAELSSDHSTSPTRTATPSPPLPPQYNKLPSPQTIKLEGEHAATKPQLPPVPEAPEAAVEANLGRKRCITFACNKKPAEKPAEKPSEKPTEAPRVPAVSTAEPPKRKCMLTFACPSRQSSSEVAPILDPRKRPDVKRPATPPPQAPISKPVEKQVAKNVKTDVAEETPRKALPIPKTDESEHSGALRFHEFASSTEEDDAWVHENIANKSKITINDYMKKENAIRQIGAEAEEEAEQEEAEAEELDDELEDDEQEDDFAPSDASSDAGNESDNEEGFAESDDESDAGSDDIFWAPTSTAATSAEHLGQFRPPTERRNSSISVDSVDSASLQLHHPVPRRHFKRNPTRPIRMRPGTPDLPDSTDFVCGTLDEDRPLEAAYISCMEQKKRAKEFPIPQDIDPSFPTSDPEDNDDGDEEEDIPEDDVDEPQWLTGQFEEVSNETYRGRRRRSAYGKKSPTVSPRRIHSPAPKHKAHRSPPPRKLFGHSPRRLRSPPPGVRVRSPPGTRRTSLEGTPNERTPVGITLNRLAQRPNMTQTASLPHTPNPYFRNYRSRRQEEPIVASITPKAGMPEEVLDRHVRGAVDIVMGLEKKRQKRKDKFWRQHCRKAAKEQAERKPMKGKGAERMKELGLECAERNRGYALGQQAQLVLSL